MGLRRSRYIAYLLGIALLAVDLPVGRALPRAVQGPSCPEGYYELKRDSINRKLYCGTMEQWRMYRTMTSELLRLDRQIAQDRTEIGRYQRDLPGYLASLDEWVALDRHGRRETRERVLDLLITGIMGGIELHARGQQAITSQELETLWQEFHSTPLDSPEFVRIIKEQARGAAIIHKWKGVEDLVSTVENIRGALKLVDEAKEGQYARAALEFVSLLSRNLAKRTLYGILAADLDFAATAITGNITARIARSRIDELLRLGETRLAAVSKPSAKLRADVDQKVKLQAQVDDLLRQTQ